MRGFKLGVNIMTTLGMEKKNDDPFASRSKRNDTEEVICPHCYTTIKNCWEYSYGTNYSEQAIECRNCSEYFYVYHQYSVLFDRVRYIKW